MSQAVQVRIIKEGKEVALNAVLALTEIPSQYMITGPSSLDNPYFVAAQLGYLKYKGLIDTWEMLTEYPELESGPEGPDVVY